jgi:hypothetical protein
MAPYFAAHAALSVTPLARRPSNTLIQETGPRRFRAQQRMIDPEGDEDWALDCIVDLSRIGSTGGATAGATDAAPAGAAHGPNDPLIELQRIGV